MSSGWAHLAAVLSAPLGEPGTAAEATPAFSTTIDPGTLYGVQTIDEAIDWTPGHRRVTRAEAMRVPAVVKGRDILTTLGSLPLKMYDSANRVTDWSLLSQPEAPPTSPVLTWTNVVDDLVFSSRSILCVTHLGWHGKPAECVRLDPENASYRPETQVFTTRTGSGTAERWQPDEQVIIIEGPKDPLLLTGARAIRILSRLEDAALNAAEGVPPIDYFTGRDGVDPVDLEDPEDASFIRRFLDSWAEARRARRTGYVPAGYEYKTNPNAFSPEQLQLVESREMAISEIARLTGLDADDLSLNTTSRVYFNAQDRRRNYIDFVIGPFMRAIESRLSMDDVTPRGYTVRFDTADFAKADDLTSAQTDEILLRSRVQETNEIRARRGLAPLDNPRPPAPAPALPAATDQQEQLA